LGDLAASSETFLYLITIAAHPISPRRFPQDALAQLAHVAVASMPALFSNATTPILFFLLHSLPNC